MKKSQVTIFVLIAVLLVSSIALLLYVKIKAPLPSKLKPAEDYFLACVDAAIKEGSLIMGEQGGYIEMPSYEQGSEILPFSSQMFFMHVSIPYWFYVSQNKIHKEQVPSLEKMQAQLANFVSKKAEECDFSSLFSEGYEIEKGSVKTAKTIIREDDILSEIEMPIVVRKGDTTAKIDVHKTRNSNSLGRLYKTARKIYDGEQKNFFLEKYALDVITLYAPTTDVELSCAPKIWLKQNVVSEIKEALENNIEKIKIKGNYYKLAKDENKYYVNILDEESKEQIAFFYSKDWPFYSEIVPSENGIMKADPIGMQEGLNILGFCYVPYHFVYSIQFPILIQVFDSEYNFFQFPVVVVIDRNKAREAKITESMPAYEAKVCKYTPQEITVYTLDEDRKPVEAFLQLKCLDTICSIGSTKLEKNEAVFKGNVPQCVNAFIVATADGYAKSKIQASTNEPVSAEIILQPLHELEFSVEIEKDESLLVSFISDEHSTSILYPEQKSIEIAPASYSVKAFLMKQGNIVLGAEKIEKCVKVPVSGIGGIFGMTREECNQFEVPEQKVTDLLIGGGEEKWNVDSEMLKEKKKLKIEIEKFALPKNILELQENFNLLKTAKINLMLE